MNSAYAFSTVTLKNEGVTNKESLKLVNDLESFLGVDVDSDWDREYPMGDMLKTILGTVSSEKTGLPLPDKVEVTSSAKLLLNDRVGTSYLEEQYEQYLAERRRL